MNYQAITPLSTIEDTYGQGLISKGQFIYNFSNKNILPELQKLDEILEAAVQDNIAIYRIKHGFKGAPISWGNERKNLQEDIRNDPVWQKATLEIINLMYPSLLDNNSPETIYKNNTLPDWTGVLTTSSGDSYNPDTGIVTIDGMYSHVMFKQLARLGIEADLKNRPVGQTNILFVEGGKYVVLGLRGGGSWANTYHGLGSGTVQLKAGKNDPIFDTVYGELEEELALSKNNIKDEKISLVGKVVDHLLAETVVYISSCEVDMGLKDFTTYWNNVKAEDKAEHTAIKVFETTNKDFLIQTFADNAIKEEYMNLANKTIVAPENMYKILPSSVSGIIPALAAQFKLEREWIPYAADKMDGIICVSNSVRNCYKKTTDSLYGKERFNEREKRDKVYRRLSAYK